MPIGWSEAATGWREAAGHCCAAPPYRSTSLYRDHYRDHHYHMNTLDLFRLDGKTAIVTGGGRGLGRYIAEALADAGAAVFVCSRHLEACEEVAQGIVQRGGRADTASCDVTHPDDVEHIVNAVQQTFGAIDILVNNSGATWGALPEDMPLERFRAVQEVNVTGTFLFSQAAGRVMIAQQRGGRIINVASVAGLLGSHPALTQVVGYATSKGAVIAMTRELATSWARHGITVNALAPGWFPTKMSRAVIERNEEVMLAHIPLGRFGGPNDIKGAALFLASPASAYMTGQILVIDGGGSAW
jgi:NAD(P)-dependent dehydrogenase (short-subunit alcohol dehydrogenase family)